MSDTPLIFQTHHTSTIPKTQNSALPSRRNPRPNTALASILQLLEKTHIPLSAKEIANRIYTPSQLCKLLAPDVQVCTYINRLRHYYGWKIATVTVPGGRKLGYLLEITQDD